jgi:hypothetical protein
MPLGRPSNATATLLDAKQGVVLLELPPKGVDPGLKIGEVGVYLPEASEDDHDDVDTVW